jgi:MFS family permease
MLNNNTNQIAPNTKRIKVCILAVAMMQMCFVGLSAAIADIAKAFPSYSVTVIQTGVNSINLVGVAGALVGGYLSYKYSKKALTLIGLSLVCLGGILGFFFHNSIEVFYCWSFVIGFGMGMYTPLVTSLIVDFFEGDARNRLSGMQTSFINGGGVILTFAGGLLAAAAWYFSYLAFLVSIPVIIICVVSMPKTNRFAAEKAAKPKMPRVVIFYMAAVFLSMLIYNVFPSNIAIYLSEHDMGNASVAGAANAVFMVGGVVFGFVFSKFSLRIGDYLFPVSHLVLAICFLILCLEPNVIVVFIAAFVGGSSISMSLPQSVFSVSTKIPPAISAGVISLVASIAPSIGTFLSPSLFGVLGKLVSDTGESISRYMAAGILSIIFAAGLFLVIRRGMKADAARTKCTP